MVRYEMHLRASTTWPRLPRWGKHPCTACMYRNGRGCSLWLFQPWHDDNSPMKVKLPICGCISMPFYQSTPIPSFVPSFEHGCRIGKGPPLIVPCSLRSKPTFYTASLSQSNGNQLPGRTWQFWSDGWRLADFREVVEQHRDNRLCTVPACPGRCVC